MGKMVPGLGFWGALKFGRLKLALVVGVFSSCA
jgi:hypothetical protein